MGSQPRPGLSMGAGTVAPGDALLTDQYTITMAQSFWIHDQADEQASFELFVRSLPEHRGFLLAAGLETAVDYLRHWHFSDEDLAFLATQGIYKLGFIDYLSKLRFDGDLDAIPEGTVIPAQAPILRIRAPRAVASMVESALLTLINHQTMIASKAARVVSAADGRAVWDFSLRRLHGLGGAFGVARAAYIAGCAGTATVAAGRELGIPTTGTMAHHYVQGFGRDHEQQAFEQFLEDYPDNGVLLVDTYDTIEGTKRAMAASRSTGIVPKALRLDSGDLEVLSKQVRQILDEAGFNQTLILASNDLDEYKIAALLGAGAPIDAFGVGTMLGTSADAPYLGGVYKAVSQETKDQRPEMLMKLAPGKLTDPGHHQIWRDKNSYLLALEGESVDSRYQEVLLAPVLKDGELTSALPSLEEIKGRAQFELGELPVACQALNDPQPLQLQRSPGLQELRQQLST